MNLTEIFEAPYKFTIDKDGDDFKATFEDSAGKPIIMKFDWWPSPEMYEVNFSRSGHFEMTGGGDAVRIFSTVISIMKAFTAEHNPKFLGFGSSQDEHSRTALYRRLMKKFIPGSPYFEVLPDFSNVSHKIAPHFFRNMKTMYTHTEHMFLARKDLQN